jgi:preprotein translocase subunit SecY
MIQAILNIFKIPELRNKLMFTFGALMIYRLGFWVPLPGINQAELAALAEKTREGGEGLGDVLAFINMFTGGSLGQSTLFGLGILPYISASIIIQLMATVVESLKQLQKEPQGRQKIQEATRYVTFGLCIVQSMMYVKFFTSQGLVYPGMQGSIVFYLSCVIGMTTGTMFLMWLGEQIDKYGIGNGASLIITGGIIASMPGAITWIVNN